MAQLHYDAYHAPSQGPQGASEPLRVGAMVNVVGAILSVALLAGVGVWSYRLMVRDVSGVPVIQALEGPMRISPTDPGGRQAAYQGLAVNAVAAEGTARATSDEILLAPAPVNLAQEDRPAVMPVAQSPQPPQPPQAPHSGGTLQAIHQSLEQPVAVSLSLGEIELVPAGTAGVARSPIPQRRPGVRASVQMAAVSSGVPIAQDGRDAEAEALLAQLATRLGPARHVDIDPASLTPGTRLVQLGAYDDEAAARDAWEVLAARFSAHLDGRGRLIEPATSGGRTFFRLRAHGFTDEPQARRFCAVLLAENADCIPVLIR